MPTLTTEEKQIADAIAAVKYDESKEGKLDYPNYDGMAKAPETCKEYSFYPLMGEKPETGGYESNPRKVRPTNKIADTALDFVGNTPLIRLERLKKQLNLPEGIELVGKAECYSAGGSVKDRIALRMIEQAEKEGKIKPGDILIEPTSGNTGVGLCMAGAIKGYKVVITMPLKMSGEKLNMMKALGAIIYRTPTEAGWRDLDSHIALAVRLQKALPNATILDQYKNPNNPLAHYEGTAAEIVEQCQGKLDYMVATAGTGGTLTGLSKGIKKDIPGCKVVGVDPKGSILALPANLNDCPEMGKPYHVEGIGYDFIPTVLDQNAADIWVKTVDPESFKMARTIIKTEGIMCGGSCGSCMAGCLNFIKEQNITEGRICVLFADHTRNYMSKFLDDEWMTKNGFDLETY